MSELQKAGFGPIDVAVQPRASAAADARQVALGLVAESPLANQVAERSPPSLEEVAGAVEQAVAAEFGTGPIAAPMQAFQTSAGRA